MKLIGAVLVLLGVVNALPYPRSTETGPGAGDPSGKPTHVRLIPFSVDVIQFPKSRENALMTNEVDTEGDDNEGRVVRIFGFLPIQNETSEQQAMPSEQKAMLPEPARFLTPPAEGQEPTYFQPDVNSDLRQPAIILAPPMVREPMDSYMPRNPEASETVPEEPPRDLEYTPLSWTSLPEDPKPAPGDQDSYAPIHGDSNSEGTVAEVPPPSPLPDSVPAVPKAEDSYLPMPESNPDDAVTEVPPAENKEVSESQGTDTVAEVPPPEQSDDAVKSSYIPSDYLRGIDTARDFSEGDESYGAKQARAYDGEKTVPESPPADTPSQSTYPEDYPPPADGPDKRAMVRAETPSTEEAKNDEAEPKSSEGEQQDESPESERYSDDRSYLPESAKTGVSVDSVPDTDAPVSYDSKEDKDSYVPDPAETSGYGDDYASFGVPPEEDAPMTDANNEHAHDSNHTESKGADSAAAAEDSSSRDLSQDTQEEDGVAATTAQPLPDESEAADSDSDESDSEAGVRTKRGVCSTCGGGGGGAYVGVGIGVPIVKPRGCCSQCGRCNQGPYIEKRIYVQQQPCNSCNTCSSCGGGGGGVYIGAGFGANPSPSSSSGPASSFD